MKPSKKAKTKEVSCKPMNGPGTQVEVSAKIGGVANACKPNSLPSSKK